MKLDLQLRYSSAAVRPAQAWLLPGPSPAQWLAELTTWRVPLEGVRLIALPHGGALALPGPGKADLAPHLNSALPYGCAGTGLYLPVEAVLDPPVSDAELRALLAGESIYIWQPASGLTRFSFEQAVPISELLAVPPLGTRVWDAAEPGTAENGRLLSIAPDSPMSLDDVMEAGREDIGKNPLAGSELPPAPGEPQGGAMGRAIKSAGLGALSAGAGLLAKIAQGLGSMGGGAGSAPGSPARGKSWLQRLADWAKEQQQAMHKNIDQLRNNLIERLLNLLKTSPDAGLAFALPLTGGGEHRGLAPPGAHLPPRDVNFNLRRLGGGGPADFWNLPYDYQQALRQRYRELANREIALGRHRRAAYILAELLGDISAAASALRDGKHFREAAVLFEKKLNQPLVAAQCLQLGGLLTEAIVLYERLEAWETVAEIYDQLEQGDEAAAAWRKAVVRHLRADDQLGAANLLEKKLKQPEEAYDVLWSSWPAKPQGKLCLEASFGLLARLGEHERARQQVRKLPTRVHVGTQLGDLTQSLAKLANNYPQDEVRAAAADVTRRIAAENLPQHDDSLTQTLLKSLADLVPEDKLLSRDCFRYRSQHAEKLRPKPVHQTLAKAGANGPRLVQTIHLPAADWKAAVSIGSEYYAAGIAEGKLLLIRGRWDGGIQHPVGEPWRIVPGQSECPILLAADPRGVSHLYVHWGSTLPKNHLKFPVAGGFPDPLVARAYPVAGDHTFGIGYTLGGGTTIANRSTVAGWILRYDPAFTMTGNLPFDFPLGDEYYLESLTGDPGWEPAYFERAGWHYLGLEKLVMVLGPQNGTTTLHSKVRAILGSPPHTRPRIIFACEQGGAILWGESASSSQTIFAHDMANPVVGLSRGGHLIAANSERVQVYRTSNTPMPYLGESPTRGVEPVAVLAHEQLDRFGILSADGRVAVYEVRNR